MDISCPRCGKGSLRAFSPSGNGMAACDNCNTYWDEGTYFVPASHTHFNDMHAACRNAEETNSQVIFLPYTAEETSSAVCFSTGMENGVLCIQGATVIMADGVVMGVSPVTYHWTNRDLLRDAVRLESIPTEGTRLTPGDADAIKNLTREEALVASVQEE